MLTLQAQEKPELLSTEFKKVYRKLHNTYFSMQATGQKYRVINNWDSKGILSSNRLNQKGWRKFNSFELVWIRIITSLREFGLPIEMIKQCKDGLFQKADLFLDANLKSSVNRLEEMVVSSLLTGQQFVISLKPEGEVQILDSISHNLNLTSAQLFIPLSPIIENILSKEEKMYAESAKLDNYRDEEVQALDIIEKEDYEKIVLSFDGKAPLIIKGDDKAVYKNQCRDTILKGVYRKIMILRRGGKVLSISSDSNLPVFN